MKLFRFSLLALLIAAVAMLEVQAQPAPPPLVDGLLWGVNPQTGQSCPYTVPNPSPAKLGPYIAASGKLDRVKYNGYNAAYITYEFDVVFLYVTPLNAQGQPVAAQVIQFQGTGSNDTGNFGFVTTNRWDPNANNKMGGEVPYAGFPIGKYEVKVVAKIKLVTPEKQNPPPMPPTPATTEKRDAILLTTPFEVS